MYKTDSSRISGFLHLLLFLIVASSVLTYWRSAEYALNGNWHPEYYIRQSFVSLVPTWQKILKDLLALLLLAFSLIVPPTTPNPDENRDNSLAVIYTLCLSVLGLAIARCVTSDLRIIEIFISLRPIIFTISLFIFCHRHLNAFYLIPFLEGLNILAGIQIFYSILQRYSAIVNNGAGWLSSGFVRSVGTFIGPNTLGFFLALVVYVNLYILCLNNLRRLFILACAISIFFTGSRTSLLILLLFIVEIIFDRAIQSSVTNKNRSLIRYFGVIVSPLILIAALWYISNVSGRSSGAFFAGHRVEIFLNYFTNTDIFSIVLGNHLGFGSEILIALKRGQMFGVGSNSSHVIADSTWTYLFYQFGIMGIILFIAIIYVLWKIPNDSAITTSIKLKLNHQKRGLGIFIFGICATSVLLESYASMAILVPLIFVLRVPKIKAQEYPYTNYYDEEGKVVDD